MRVLLVQHGRLPSPSRPGSGGAQRAHHHAEALRGAGHEVMVLTRAQDDEDGGPLTFQSHRHLRELAIRLRPDRILCVQPEEAPALAGLDAPLCVDLYAPRLLEAPFQGETAAEAVHTMRALAAADHVLFSNPRQRHFTLGLMALAGWDTRQAVGDVVPLVAPEGPPRLHTDDEPVFVLGGVPWPWQDPTPALRRAVAALDRMGFGRIVVYGGRPAVGDAAVVDLAAALPPGPRLQYAGPTPLGELLRAYAGARAALDWFSPNPERELAMSFRQADYLGCGLPLITGADHALSDAVREAGAGWVVKDLDAFEAAVVEAAMDPAAAAARGLAARHLAQTTLSREVAEAPLVRWVQEATRRDRVETPLPQAAELVAALGEARAQAQAAQAAQAKAEAEVAEKRAENAQLTEQLQALTGVVTRLSRAIDEVAGFRREAVNVLGARAAGAEGEVEALSRQVEEQRADLLKKDAELRAARREQDRLNDALLIATREGEDAGARQIELGRLLDTIKQERDALKARLKAGWWRP
ncbi:hypothetical protein L6R49_04730 [Myxococcota bacterium]|nr:hypothetical protein [Myxococcota bacterium]